MRNSMREEGLMVQVMPLAVCQFMTRLMMPAPCPEGPGMPLLGAAS